MKINCKKNDENLCHIKEKSDGKEFLKAETVHSFENICEKKDNWLIGDKIGEQSANASIRQAFCKKSKYVFKIFDFDSDSESVEEFQNEIEIQNRVAQLGFTSPIYQVFQNKDYGMFVMDEYAMTVYRFFIKELNKENPNFESVSRIFDRCLQIVHILQGHNILHTDVHLNNFMLEKADSDSVKIIDFGKCKIGKPTKILIKENSILLSSNFLQIFRETAKKYYDFLQMLAEMADSKYGYKLADEFMTSVTYENTSAIDKYIMRESEKITLININNGEFEHYQQFIEKNPDFFNENPITPKNIQEEIQAYKKIIFDWVIKHKKFKIDQLLKISFERDELYNYFTKKTKESNKIKRLVFDYIIEKAHEKF